MDEVRHIFTQLVKCVEHLHSKGVVHGDIKTLNLVRAGKYRTALLYFTLLHRVHIPFISPRIHSLPERGYQQVWPVSLTVVAILSSTFCWDSQ